MTTKPGDIPKWALDTANDHLERGKYESMTIVLARAILKAKNEALEKAATIADELFLDHTENHGDLYADDISQAIRNLKHKTEV